MKNKKNIATATFIRGARERLHITQQELADRLGIHRYNIAKYESGATEPPGGIVLRVFRFLQNNIDV